MLAERVGYEVGYGP